MEIEKFDIEIWDINKVKPYPNNPRINDLSVERVANSIRAYGWKQPIVVDKDGIIIAGHTRLKAATKLGFKKVPIHVAHDLPPDKVKAYRIMDNKSGEDSEWNEEMLSMEFGELKDCGFDMDLTGFSEDEIRKITKEETPPAIDEVPEFKKGPPVSKTGEVYALGIHRLMCGDSTNADDVKKLLGDNTATLMVTDPPYGIGFEYNSHNDESNDANSELVSKVFALGPESKVWTPGLMNLARDITRFGKCKIVVWNKKFAMAGNGLGGASIWEPILVINPPEKNLSLDVLEITCLPIKVDGKKITEFHPCPKPVKLFETILDAFTSTKDVIYEPFCGSGTTLLACETRSRKCCGMEIDPLYCDLVRRRWTLYCKSMAKDPGPNALD